MTTTDCFVNLVGLTSHLDPANPEPFRFDLPRPRSGYYWVPSVEAFARARGLFVRYPHDNLTVEIEVAGPLLAELLADAYGADHPFVARTAPYLGPTTQYWVYAEDF